MSEQNQVQFTVLLDQRSGTNLRGYTAEGEELRGAQFYKTPSNGMGVVDSIEAVQGADLLQVPAYLMANGRISAIKKARLNGNVKDALNDPVWGVWHDTHGERLTLEATESYEDLGKGAYVVDIQGVGLFMPRPDAIRQAINDKELRNRAFPVSAKDKDLLLGERQAYVFRNSELQTVPVDNFFTSYDAFEEWAKSTDFNPLDMPVYAVVRTQEEASKNPSGYKPIADQLTNADLAIPIGGKERLKVMLVDDEGDSHFGWSNFGSHHDGYETMDLGRVVVLGSGISGGVSCNDTVNSYGCSVGVAPEALNALGKKIVAPTLDQILTVGETHVSRAGQNGYNADVQRLFLK